MKMEMEYNWSAFFGYKFPNMEIEEKMKMVEGATTPLYMNLFLPKCIYIDVF